MCRRKPATITPLSIITSQRKARKPETVSGFFLLHGPCKDFFRLSADTGRSGARGRQGRLYPIDVLDDRKVSLFFLMIAVIPGVCYSKEPL